VLHLAWDQGQLSVIGWHERALPADRAHSLAASLFGKGLNPSTFTFAVPGRQHDAVAHGVILSVEQVADAFRDQTWVPWRTLSASLSWAATVAAYAKQLVDSGQVVPGIDGATGQCSWVPMIDAATADPLRALAQTMPPVFGCLHPNAKPWQLTSAFMNLLVDCIVRQRLWGTSAGGPDARDRRPVAVVTRRVLASLITGDPVVTNSSADRAALQAIGEELTLWSAGITSRSPLADFSVFVRLEPIEAAVDDAHQEDPDVDDPLFAEHEDLWIAKLFLAPTHDPSLFIDAETIWGSASNLPRNVDSDTARAALRFAYAKLLAASPTLSSRLDKRNPAAAAFPLDAIMHIVDNDIDSVNEAGIVLQLPLWWTSPKQPRMIGRATPTDAPITSAGLTAKAIVSIDWKVALGDDVLSEQELNQLAAAKYDIVSIGGRWSAIDRTTVARALTTVLRLRNQMSTASATELLAFASESDGDDERDSVDRVELTASGWADALLAGELDDRVEPIVSPHGFVGTLRPYQQRGVGWLAFLSRVGLGAVLADDMGLGKTAQLLALIAHESTGPTLVICPVSVVHNWETESARFVPALRVAVHHGATRTESDGFAEWVKQHDVIITTYATATRDADTLATVQWARVVIDEAQHVKNARTNAARALRRIPARQRIALTGTPVENRLADLWAVIDLVNPGILGTTDHFRRTLAVPIERHRDEAATKHLRSVISPLMLRRSKADKSLVPELPPKIEATAWATLTREQASLYRAVTNRLMERLPQMTGMDRRGAIVAAITRLKQICNHPVHYLGDGGRLEGRSGKLARFDELLNDAFDADDRVIAFTQYVEMGHLVQRHLAARFSFDVPFLNGSVVKRRRDAMVAEFQSGTVPLLLVSLKAGGSGLNLTAASQVIHIDRWWNPAVEDQASDRAWRIGQTSTVFVHRLATRGTIEERIDQLMDEKRALAESVIGSGTGTGEGWITELSTDDLRRLLTLEQP
jgi:superfamily II DNA or RNA helicase